jgi:hypothetical protein
MNRCIGSEFGPIMILVIVRRSVFDDDGHRASNIKHLAALASSINPHEDLSLLI